MKSRLRPGTCSMCAMVGFIHVIVPESRLRIVQGADQLTTYTFNTGVAKHLFCSACGVKPFYRPRSNPDGWSANARCLDESAPPRAASVGSLMGESWVPIGLTHGEEVAALSKDGGA